MKSEFTLALNQICSERNLPKEIITQVLESALATSYRKNANIMNSQNVAAKVGIGSSTGFWTIELKCRSTKPSRKKQTPISATALWLT